MRVLDIFSKLPEKELSLERIEELVISLSSGHTSKEGYTLEMKLPNVANENEINAAEDLINDGRKVCYLMRGEEIIAVVGYK